MESSIIASLAAMLLASVPGLIMTVVTYVLSSLGFYTLASRRGIRHAWLSWIPVANLWILGSLSDQYRYVARGQVKSKRKILLIINIICLVLGIVMMIGMFGTIFHIAGSAAYGYYEEDVAMQVVGPLMGLMGLGLPVGILSIVLMVFSCMALYDVYMSMDPENAVLFLVLSILIPVTQPFFVFFNRKKDYGMRRKQEPVYEGGYGSYQQPQNDQDHFL